MRFQAGQVAFDRGKVKVDACKRKAMSYDRMLKKKPELQAEVDRVPASPNPSTKNFLNMAVRDA